VSIETHPARRTIPVAGLTLNPFTALTGLGALLVAGADKDDANVMTIGWGMFGTMWGRPTVLTLVRPTRHTWDILARVPDFTVNWMPADRDESLRLCGTLSGRDTDKFAAAHLTATAGIQVGSPILAESVLALECRLIYRSQVDPNNFMDPALQQAYPGHDYHGLFYGEVLAATGTGDLYAGH
jgi:flavin reductase (DIM6/NTAB) family NADH-FMN oxidoreductase RutF